MALFNAQDQGRWDVTVIAKYDQLGLTVLYSSQCLVVGFLSRLKRAAPKQGICYGLKKHGWSAQGIVRSLEPMQDIQQSIVTKVCTDDTLSGIPTECTVMCPGSLLGAISNREVVSFGIPFKPRAIKDCQVNPVECDETEL